MKTVILCGGRGTRLGEHGVSVPKALVDIGGKPIIWHLMKLYSSYGLNDFVLCLGYLGNSIREYFSESPQESWNVTLADTGEDTNTGGRVKRVREMLDGDDNFSVTYGDGLSNVNLTDLIAFHRQHGRLATLTAVHPRSNFGLIKLDNAGAVTAFQEKPVISDWVNGGFFVFNRAVLNYLEDDSVLEREPLERLAGERQLIAYQHDGFWKCMDTFKDNLEFNQIWDSGNAAWKVW
jgi:glucose-1-phosphate cytidylyltransferase